MFGAGVCSYWGGIFLMRRLKAFDVVQAADYEEIGRSREGLVVD